ncbi:hypothetical protein, partial [Metaplanococcus flavidus]
QARRFSSCLNLKNGKNDPKNRLHFLKGRFMKLIHIVKKIVCSILYKKECIRADLFESLYGIITNYPNINKRNTRKKHPISKFRELVLLQYIF